MARDLRRKFVIVTMALMIILFSALLTAFYFYNRYWNDLDTLQSVEWIADSGVFLYQAQKDDVRMLAETISDDDNPVIGLIVDNKGTVLNRQAIGKSEPKPVSDEIVNGILSAKEGEWKCRSFIFSVKRIDTEKQLIVLADTSFEKEKGVRILVNVLLLVIGIALLTFVSFYLSRFVVIPAERSLQREKQFITDASHELKTPLGAISINAQALAVGDSENIHVKNIVSETRRMNRLIERLLTLARLDEEPSVLKQHCDLSAAVFEMVLTYESVAFEKQIDYRYEIDEGISIKGNEDELKQLTAILLDNAIKHTEQRGTIQISLRKGLLKSRGILSIRNSGDIISLKDLPHVFERFYSGQDQKRGDSFGLGLAIAKTIVEHHKGKITVQSEEDGYTTFFVML